MKDTGGNWGNISFKVESKLKKNEDANSEVDYSSYVTTLNLKNKQYGWVSLSYAYYLGQFKEDLSYQNRYLRFISIAKE